MMSDETSKNPIELQSVQVEGVSCCLLTIDSFMYIDLTYQNESCLERLHSSV